MASATHESDPDVLWEGQWRDRGDPPLSKFAKPRMIGIRKHEFEDVESWWTASPVDRRAREAAIHDPASQPNQTGLKTIAAVIAATAIRRTVAAPPDPKAGELTEIATAVAAEHRPELSARGPAHIGSAG